MRSGLKISLIPLKYHEQMAVEEVGDELWYWITKNIRHYGTTKPVKDVLADYFPQSKKDIVCSQNQIHFNFSDDGGLSGDFMNASLHWTRLTLAQLFTPLNEVIKPYGYEMKKPEHSLEAILEKSLDYPIVEINNTVCSVFAGKDIGISNNAHESIAFETLTPKQKKTIKEIAASGACQCTLCKKIRSGKSPVNVTETRMKEPQGFRFDKLSSALRYPHRVKNLYIPNRQYTELSSEISELKNCEELTACENALQAIGPGIEPTHKLTSVI